MLLGYASQLPKAFLDNFDEIVWILSHTAGLICDQSLLTLFQANFIRLTGHLES